MRVIRWIWSKITSIKYFDLRVTNDPGYLTIWDSPVPDNRTEEVER